MVTKTYAFEIDPTVEIVKHREGFESSGGYANAYEAEWAYKKQMKAESSMKYERSGRGSVGFKKSVTVVEGDESHLPGYMKGTRLHSGYNEKHTDIEMSAEKSKMS